jgi:hypothetical protein
MPEFWMDKEEQDFFMSFIEKNHKLLEYGSGHSTVYLQDKVDKLVSVEHSPVWYETIKKQLKDNVEYLLAPPNNPHWEEQYRIAINGEEKSLVKNFKADDGGFEDFISYAMAPLNTGVKFDRVFVDGRARVSCAFISKYILEKDGLIFIHDFGPEASHPFEPYRVWYDLVYNFLEEVDHVKTMYCFKPKA